MFFPESSGARLRPIFGHVAQKCEGFSPGGEQPGTGDETLGKVMESDFLDEMFDGKSTI